MTILTNILLLTALTAYLPSLVVHGMYLQEKALQ